MYEADCTMHGRMGKEQGARRKEKGERRKEKGERRKGRGAGLAVALLSLARAVGGKLLAQRR